MRKKSKKNEKKLLTLGEDYSIHPITGRGGAVEKKASEASEVIRNRR